MEHITILICILLIITLITVIQYARRNESVRYVHGLDMRGIDRIKGFSNRITWIRKHPDYTKGMDAHRILFLWETKDTLLDNS